MSALLKKTAVDGRRARSERSRQAIIESAVALMEEGILVPTAQQISDRSGLGIRSFFRHFEDMETLFDAVDRQVRDGYASPFLGGNRHGTLEERLRHAVQHHADAYEKLWNVFRSTQAQLWRSAVIRKNHARSQRALRKDLDEWLPELNELSKTQREAVDAIASFDMWHRLREHQNLSKSAGIEVVHQLLSQTISPA